MKTMIIREDNNPDYSITHMIEAFADIYQCMKSDLFDNLEYGHTADGQPALWYDVVPTDTAICKVFNADQGAPELKADIITYLFSMLDSAANL